MDMTELILRLMLLWFTVKALELRSPPARPLAMPCVYDYEVHGGIQQLSLQWHSPAARLLCNFIKHKAYRNCTAGYSVLYAPGNATLVIDSVKEEDYGKHVCTVSKHHDFLDYIIYIMRAIESSTSPPAAKGEHSGCARNHLFLLGCSLFVSVFGC
ncbi:uncharacterized protein LOC143518176 [Brachyhypopomus gauderio]|uniref:uncharacterized protein LOC143518176 n=1 Tax=Brachyhypopomus gauderio TaxID=698409 RepID=UPI0040429BC3